MLSHGNITTMKRILFVAGEFSEVSAMAAIASAYLCRNPESDVTAVLLSSKKKIPDVIKRSRQTPVRCLTRSDLEDLQISRLGKLKVLHRYIFFAVLAFLDCVMNARGIRQKLRFVAQFHTAFWQILTDRHRAEVIIRSCGTHGVLCGQWQAGNAAHIWLSTAKHLGIPCASFVHDVPFSAYRLQLAASGSFHSAEHFTFKLFADSRIPRRANDKGDGLYPVSAPRLLAMAANSLKMEGNAWCGGAAGTPLLLESQMLRLALGKGLGTSAKEMTVVGSPQLDRIAQSTPADLSWRREGKACVLISPPKRFLMYKDETFDGFVSTELIALADAVAKDPNIEILFSLHPTSSPGAVEYLRHRGIPFLVGDIESYLASADIFVTGISQTMKWSLALGMPTIVYDTNGGAAEFFSSCDAENGLVELVDSVDALTTAVHRATDRLGLLSPRRNRVEWGVMDGRCTTRIVEELQALFGEPPHVRPIQPDRSTTSQEIHGEHS